MNGSCGWSSDIFGFNEAETSLIMDSVENFVRDYSQEQLAAWREEISILRNVASKLVASNAFSREYGIILEYRLPYENRRPDVIVLAKDTVIVLEFKSKSHATQADLDQAFDQLCRMLAPGNVVHRGIYSGDKDSLTVFTTIGGLARPEEKLKELKKLGDLKK